MAIRLFIACGIVLGSLITSAIQPLRAQSESKTIAYPLAYTDAANNLVLMDTLTQEIVPVTSDGRLYLEAYGDGLEIRYGNPRWSPDGNLLLFADIYNSRFFITENSGSTKPFLTEATLAASVMAWSPDGSEVAFFQFDKGLGSQLYRQSMAGGDPQAIITAGGGCFGEAPGPELGIFALAREFGQHPLREVVSVDWLAAGLLYQPGSKFGCSGLMLVSPTGSRLWTEEINEPFEGIIAPDNSRFVINPYDLPPYIMTVQGRQSIGNLPIPADSRILGFSSDGQSVFYSQRTDERVVRIDDSISIPLDEATTRMGAHLYDDFHDYELTVYLQSLAGGDPSVIYQTRGFEIAAVQNPPIDGYPYIISVVRSGAEAIEALNNGIFGSELLPLLTHVDLVAMMPDETEPRWIIWGSQPVYGPSSFTIQTP